MAIKLPIIVVLAVSVFSCKISKLTISADTNDLHRNISEIIKLNFSANDSIQVMPNSTNELELYLTESKSDNLVPNNQINFIIYDKNKELVIYQNRFDNANVKWYNDKQLMLIRYLGIKESPDVENKQVFLINVITGEIKVIEEIKSKL